VANIRTRSGETLGPESINRHMKVLRMILDEAADRFEFVTPYRGIKPLKVPKSDIEPFTLEEIQRILGNVRPDFKAYFTVRFFTGMRTAEIDGLQWKYVDFDKRQILIRETLVRGEVSYTKNDSSQREIHMSQPVFDALKAQQSATGVGTFVFTNRAGNPLQHYNVTKRVWYPLLRYLGLPKRNPYQTRHTAATLWLASGETPEWIARQMGHSNTEMLFRVYSRYVPNLTRNDGSAFESLLTRELGGAK
jgi:integrase